MDISFEYAYSSILIHYNRSFAYYTFCIVYTYNIIYDSFLV